MQSLPDPSTLARVAIACAALHAAAAAQPPTVLYVDDDAPPGGDGSTWGTAFDNLQTALAAVAPGSPAAEIRIGQGTYTPAPPGGSREATFTLTSSATLTLAGGFAGYGAVNPDENDPARFPSILSGDLNGDDGPNFTNYEDNSFVVVTAINTEMTLRGLTIRGGNNTRSEWPNYGGGGGVYSHWDATLQISDSVITENHALHGGGFKSYGNATIRRCLIRGNRANDGGAVSLYAAPWDQAVIEATTFVSNHATLIAGALSFQGNASATGCLFTDNSAGYMGGAIVASDEARIDACTFAGNQAASGGGAIYVPSYRPNNIVRGCTMWGNTLPSIGHKSWAPVFIEVLHSCIEGGYPGVGNIDADPRFIDPAAGDYRLSPFSPCIDAGDNAAIPAGVTLDLAGLPRFRDDPWTANTGPGKAPIVDMGAYEFQSSSCYADCNNDGTLSVADFACFQGKYVLGDVYADCNASGSLTVADFGCFQGGYVIGCP